MYRVSASKKSMNQEGLKQQLIKWLYNIIINQEESFVLAKAKKLVWKKKWKIIMGYKVTQCPVLFIPLELGLIFIITCIGNKDSGKLLERELNNFERFKVFKD